MTSLTISQLLVVCDSRGPRLNGFNGSQNFDRLAFNGSAIGNPSPAFAVESQKLSMANALGANSLRPLTDSSLACPPLPQYGTRSVAEVQQILSSIDTNTTPRELAQAGIIQLSDAVRKEMLQQPEGLTLPEAKSATVNDLSLVFTTSAKDDLVNKTDNPPADYFIGKDGSITMLTDPSKVESDHKLVFALEGDGSDQSKLPDPQRLKFELVKSILGHTLQRSSRWNACHSRQRLDSPGD